MSHWRRRQYRSSSGVGVGGATLKFKFKFQIQIQLKTYFLVKTERVILSATTLETFRVIKTFRRGGAIVCRGSPMRCVRRNFLEVQNVLRMNFLEFLSAPPFYFRIVKRFDPSKTVFNNFIANSLQ
jgi:hypothetical protein